MTPDDYGLARRPTARVLRVEGTDGRQYWQVRIPDWWLRLFGYGYIKGNLWQRFWAQRWRRKHTVTGEQLDKLAAMYNFTREYAESDHAFRNRIMRWISDGRHYRH